MLLNCSALVMIIMLMLVQASGGSVWEVPGVGWESEGDWRDGTRSTTGQDGRHLSDVCKCHGRGLLLTCLQCLVILILIVIATAITVLPSKGFEAVRPWKTGISHWLHSSPLQQCRHYRAALWLVIAIAITQSHHHLTPSNMTSEHTILPRHNFFTT